MEHKGHQAVRTEHAEEENLPSEDNAHDHLPDSQLWDLFRCGDQKAFDSIYEQLFQPLCLYGDKICRNPSLVEDVIQDLFIHLWTIRERLGATSSIKFYLFLSLRRMLIRRMKQEAKDHSTSVDDVKFPLQLADSKLSAQQEEEEENLKLLSAALSKLTDRQREAIYLKFYNNLSFQEVAEVMEIEVRSVYNLISRTIDVLRADLNGQKVNQEMIIPSSLLSLLLTALELI